MFGQHVVSRSIFGVMSRRLSPDSLFFSSSDAPHRSAYSYRVAKLGAQVLIMTPGNPEERQVAILLTALQPLLPPPPPGASGPFALSDETALRAFAVGAGLTPTELFDVGCHWIYPSLSVAQRGLRS